MFAIKNSTANPSQIAGFWRRLFAFWLDGAVLGIIGLFLGYFLYDYFASMGKWGQAIGFVITLSYSGIMNSYILGGQTLGKMAMKIKVVSINGTPLSVTASFFRSSIFCAPFFLNGAIPNVDFLNSWLQSTLSSLVFGVGLSIVYLFIFNRKTRQSLHDLAVGSYVVRVGLETVPLPTSCIWRGHCQPQVVMSALSQIEMSAFEHKLSPVKHRGGYREDGHTYESKGSETRSTIGFIEG